MNKRVFSIILITILGNVYGMKKPLTVLGSAHNMEKPLDHEMCHNKYVKELHETWPEFNQSPERETYLKNCINGDQESCKKLVKSLDNLHLKMKKQLDRFADECKFRDDFLKGEAFLPVYSDDTKKRFPYKQLIFFKKWDNWFDRGTQKRHWQSMNNYRNKMGLPSVEFDANKTGAQLFFETYLALQERKHKVDDAIAEIQFPITHQTMVYGGELVDNEEKEKQ